MAVSPPLFHSSQDKVLAQWMIEGHQRVSDKCGSGVVRVVQKAQFTPCVCSLCVVYSLLSASISPPGSPH